MSLLITVLMWYDVYHEKSYVIPSYCSMNFDGSSLPVEILISTELLVDVYKCRLRSIPAHTVIVNPAVASLIVAYLWQLLSRPWSRTPVGCSDSAFIAKIMWVYHNSCVYWIGCCHLDIIIHCSVTLKIDTSEWIITLHHTISFTYWFIILRY